MKILGIDTSTTLFSLCLNEDNRVLYELRCERSFYKDSKDGHFFASVQGLFQSMKDTMINGIAVSIGPGMFTSLRVGLALAKGLSLGQNIPICGVNSLDAIGYSFPLFGNYTGDINKYIWAPIINAFQGEIYAAFYNKKGKIGKDLLFTPEGFINYVETTFKGGSKVVIIGPGTKVLKESRIIINKKILKRLIILESDFFNPTASKVVSLALPRISDKNYDNPDLLEPYYIKKVSVQK